jgi:hypothetical protein
MKRILLPLLLIISCTGIAQSRNEKAIREIMDNQTKAWNRGDIQGFMEGYWKNDSLMFIGKSGVTYAGQTP